MAKLVVVTRDGTEKTVEGQAGLSVMEIIRDAGFDELLALWDQRSDRDAKGHYATNALESFYAVPQIGAVLVPPHLRERHRTGLASGGDRLLGQRVEITARGKGPVARAEASADSFYAAFESVIDKLESRLRRTKDRKKVHYGDKRPVSVAEATASLVE